MDSDFRDYVTARSATLLRTAYLLTRNHADAEDLLQDALFKLSIAWTRVHQSESLDGYVRKTMVNLHISKWRRRKVRTTTVDRLPDVPSRDLATETLSVRDEIWRALATLPPRMRAALVLRFYEDMSEVEIASALGCAVGTVKSQTARGLAKLRETVPEWSTSMIDNELVATLRDRASTSLSPDTGRVLEAIEGRRVRRQRLRVAGAAIATLAVVGAVTGITIGLHGSSNPPAPVPPAKHTPTAAPTGHTTIKVTSTVALNPGLSTSEATGEPIATEAPDGTVYYAIGSQVTQVRKLNGVSATFYDAGSPVIAIAATSSHVVVMAQKLISDTGLGAHENSLSSTENSNGSGVWPTPGASSTAPVNDGGVAVEGDVAYVWDRHDSHGNPPAALSRINLSTGTLTVVDQSLAPGDVYADQNGVFYNNESNGLQLARVGPTGPVHLVPHGRDLGILGLDEGVLVGDYPTRHGPQAWTLIDARTLKTVGAVRPQGTFGDRLTSTTPAILTLLSNYPCLGSGSCEPTAIYALYRERSALVDSGSLTLPHTELLLSGGPAAAITGGSAQYLVRLSVSTPSSVAVDAPEHTAQVP